MNEFIKKNKGLLRFYCHAAHVIGWVLLIIPPIAYLIESRSAPWAGQPLFILYAVEALVSRYMLLGVVVLGIAQFIRYIYESAYQPGWILRHGDKILCFYAAFLIVGSVVEYCFHAQRIKFASNFSLLLYLVSLVLPAIAKVLILVGFVQILRRIMPVIEESKTLV